MTIIRWGFFGALALLVGCAQSVSGDYVAQGAQFVELLQITQSQDGQLLGTLHHTAVNPDGSTEQFALNVSGTTDGHSITLIGKASEPFAIPSNMSGTVDTGGITLMQAGGAERFIKSSADVYQADVSQLGIAAAATQQRNAQQQQQQQQQQQVAAQEQARANAQQQHIEQENQYAGDLADKLTAYAAMVQQHHDLTPFHAGHTKILAAARHDLDVEGTYPKGSVQRGQVDVRINQLDGQLTQFDIPWGQNVDRGRMHLQEFDDAIAKSPCHTTQDTLSNCAREQEAEATYSSAKGVLQGELNDLEATIKNDTNAMNAIVKEADASE